MNSEQENFHQLRRLLTVKRYEHPPPGFFDGLSTRIISRIRAGDAGDAGAGIAYFFWEAPWVQRLLSALEHRPALAGAFGLSVCGLLLAGILCSVAPAEPGRADLLSGAQSLAAIAVPQATDPSPVFVSSTNGLLPGHFQDSLFQRSANSQAQSRFIRDDDTLLDQ
jgi:hypothetical protein